MAGEENGGKNGAKNKYQKSYFDVLGICCSSEVPLIEKIVYSLDGIVTVSVIVPTRTVIVVHDGALVSQLEIVKALNQARLEATVRAYGKGKGVRHLPSPYTIACGVLLAVSFLKPVYRPLQWLAVAAVAAGLPPILLRAIAAIRRFTLDINILMLIAVCGAYLLQSLCTEYLLLRRLEILEKFVIWGLSAHHKLMCVSRTSTPTQLPYGVAAYLPVRVGQE